MQTLGNSACNILIFYALSDKHWGPLIFREKKDFSQSVSEGEARSLISIEIIEDYFKLSIVSANECFDICENI